jgi:hypothetical protein
MKPRTTVGLVVLAAIAVGAGWYYGVGRTPAPETSAPVGTLVFPGLAPKLQNAAKVEIVHGGQTLTLERVGDGWGLASSADYPVQQSKLRELLTGLTELRFVEQRTADPAQFSRLEVEDPQEKSAASTLVRVLDEAGQPIAELIVGRSRPRAEGTMSDQVYIRRPNETQAWLAEGQVPVNSGSDAKQWLDKLVADIDASKIASVTADRGSDKLQFTAKDGTLGLTAPADHPPLDESKVTEVGRALERVTFVDVRKDVDVGSATETAHSAFVTTDGEEISATLLKLGDETWIRLAATGTDAGTEAAKQLDGRVHGWLYQLGSWKERNLFPTMDDIKAPPPPKPEASAPEAGAPASPTGMPPMPPGHPTLALPPPKPAQ